MISIVAVKVLAALGIAVAGAAAAAHTGVAPGIAVAFNHVPTWTHAHSVLEAVRDAFQSGQHPGSSSGHP